MIIDFTQMEETAVPNFRGGEKEALTKIYSDETVKIMHLRLIPGASVGLHTHETSSEVIYILEGSGTMLYNDVQEPLFPGVCHYCPKGHSHSLINTGEKDLVYFAAITEYGVGK